MEKAYLVADSGGTKTDWCLINKHKETEYFITESYHPGQINEKWIKNQGEFWIKYTSQYDLHVYFYGAGCLIQENQKKIQHAFNHWGIKTKIIESDVLAAAKATIGDNDGWVAIMGTGSVLAQINNQKLVKTYGGLGPILGDQGSGFYFGKMLLEHLLNNRFGKEETEYLCQFLGGRAEILSKVYSDQSKFYISNLSQEFDITPFETINQLHQQNIKLFLNDKAFDLIQGSTISFVGSYAYKNQETINQLLNENGMNSAFFIQRPISGLAAYHRIKTF